MIEESYNHKLTEPKWRKYWKEHKIYRWDSSKSRAETFVIDTPPPTVSGLLHMGHIYSYTQADFIARFQRMRGKSVFYPIGFDDNGLPTERLVEKDRNIRAGKTDRAEFIKICKEVVALYEEEFRDLFKSMAMSFDWEQEYQTINDRTRLLSQMSFIDLYNKGLLYRKDSPTFWDTVDQTAIAQAEIEDKEQTGLMIDVRFETTSGSHLMVATTRPEMLPACVAIFYHPDDIRYQAFKDQTAVTPIFNQKVPILSNSAVDPEKGTGAVMCCTFGDIQDVKWWQEYRLPIKNCVNKFGQMQNAQDLNGLKIKAAREAIIASLTNLGLISNQKHVLQAVKSAERSGSALEIIPSNQWYIAIMEQKEWLLEQSSKCSWHPEHMKIRLENWIKGLNQDWCISRQRYFGIPFPVWYSKRAGEEGKVLIANIDHLPVDPATDLPAGYSAEEITPELDVMDTWATSSLTPQISSWGINDAMTINSERYNKLFPADLRPQAHEIIRTWAFTTIVKSLYHQGVLPWKNLMISGWCLTADKTKMSKSKGNAITPQKLIQEKSADVVRYWASNAKLGADTIYSEEAFKAGNKLVNKIWSIAKFCSIHLPKLQSQPISIRSDIATNKIYETTDLWILSKLYQINTKIVSAFEHFEYSDARVLAENFFFKDYCDNYIELAKHRLYDDSNCEAQQSGIITLYHSLASLLKFFAPFLPYLTEEIYQRMFNDQISVHAAGSWPIQDENTFNNQILATGNSIVSILELVRKAKSLANYSIAKQVDLIEVAMNIKDPAVLRDLIHATNTKDIAMIDVENLASDAIRSECGQYGVKIHSKLC